MKPILVLCSAVLAFALAPTAAAAPPANDDFDSATNITVLPFSDAVDTTEATVAADDPTTACLVDTPIFTIWYAFTPPTNMRLVLTAGISTPTVFGMSTFTGTRGNLSEVSCQGIGGTRFFDVDAGTTYYFMFWGFAAGVVQFDLSEVLPPPSIALDINSRGTVNPKTGVATVSGTLTCSRSVVLPNLDVALSQVFARRVTIVGLGTLLDFPCSSSGSPWSVVLEGANGRFAPGSAMAEATTSFCNEEGICTFAQVLGKSIRLRGS